MQPASLGNAILLRVLARFVVKVLDWRVDYTHGSAWLLSLLNLARTRLEKEAVAFVWVWQP